MFGHGVTMYIVLFTTSGAASCPRVMPVEKVNASFRVLHIVGIDLIERAVTGAGVVLGRPDPLPIVGIQLDPDKDEVDNFALWLAETLTRFE